MQKNSRLELFLEKSLQGDDIPARHLMLDSLNIFLKILMRL